jgi:hypothetical protein
MRVLQSSLVPCSDLALSQHIISKTVTTFKEGDEGGGVTLSDAREIIGKWFGHGAHAHIRSQHAVVHDSE